MTRANPSAEYNGKLRSTLGALERELRNLQGEVLTATEIFGDEFLKNPSIAGLEILAGITKTSIKDITGAISSVGQAMRASGLNPSDFYTATRPVFSDRADAAHKVADAQKAEAAKAHPKRARDLRIRAFFSEALRNALREILIPELRDIYQERAENERTTCGAPCVDGHPCQNRVWQGERCYILSHQR